MSIVKSSLIDKHPDNKSTKVCGFIVGNTYLYQVLCYIANEQYWLYLRIT